MTSKLTCLWYGGLILTSFWTWDQNKYGFVQGVEIACVRTEIDILVWRSIDLVLDAGRISLGFRVSNEMNWFVAWMVETDWASVWGIVPL